MNNDEQQQRRTTKKAFQLMPAMPRPTVGDLVYSETRQMVGVIRGIDGEALDIHIGHGSQRFFENGGQLVSPVWDAANRTYAWERAILLVDE